MAAGRASLEVNILSYARPFARPRLPQATHPYYRDLRKSCPPLPVRVYSSTSDCLSCLSRLEQRLEPWNAAANDAQLDLDRRPQPYLEAVPCDIVRLLDNVVDPVDADAAGGDDD